MLTAAAAGLRADAREDEAMLTWEDNFDGPAGAPPDTVWSAVVNGEGGGNQELQYYVPEASALDGRGNLVLTAGRDTGTYPAWYGKSQFTSGKLWTRGRMAFRYGHLEVRAAIPCAGQPGAWPAIWMLGSDFSNVGWPACGEIDILESFGKNGDPRQISAALHCPSLSPSQLHELPDGADATQFHTYTLDWRPGSVAIGVDGVTYFTMRRSQMGATYPFDQPFFLILNVAVGGTMGGAVPAGAALPYQMVVDYVRLYGGQVWTSEQLLG